MTNQEIVQKYKGSKDHLIINPNVQVSLSPNSKNSYVVSIKTYEGSSV